MRTSLLATVTALGIASSLAIGFAAGAGSSAPTSSAFVAKGDVKWTDAAIPGIQIAAVQGDMATGPSHFLLKYPAGFASPPHHHSPDHYAVTVSGNLVLTADGKDHPLPPGSFFAFTNKASHVARCEGAEACVMFIDARGKWDVVPE